MVSEPFVVMSFCYLSQIVIWIVIPSTRNGRADHANNTLSLIVLIQYIPRLFVIFPLHQRIIKSTGFVAKTAWAGAAYNLLLYMLASHVSIRSPLFFVVKKRKKVLFFLFLLLKTRNGYEWNFVVVAYVGIFMVFVIVGAAILLLEIRVFKGEQSWSYWLH